MAFQDQTHGCPESGVSQQQAEDTSKRVVALEAEVSEQVKRAHIFDKNFKDSEDLIRHAEENNQTGRDGMEEVKKKMQKIREMRDSGLVAHRVLEERLSSAQADFANQLKIASGKNRGPNEAMTRVKDALDALYDESKRLHSENSDLSKEIKNQKTLVKSLQEELSRYMKMTNSSADDVEYVHNRLAVEKEQREHTESQAKRLEFLHAEALTTIEQQRLEIEELQHSKREAHRKIEALQESARMSIHKDIESLNDVLTSMKELLHEVEAKMVKKLKLFNLGMNTPKSPNLKRSSFEHTDSAAKPRFPTGSDTYGSGAFPSRSLTRLGEILSRAGTPPPDRDTSTSNVQSVPGIVPLAGEELERQPKASLSRGWRPHSEAAQHLSPSTSYVAEVKSPEKRLDAQSLAAQEEASSRGTSGVSRSQVPLDDPTQPARLKGDGQQLLASTAPRDGPPASEPRSPVRSGSFVSYSPPPPTEADRVFDKLFASMSEKDRATVLRKKEEYTAILSKRRESELKRMFDQDSHEHGENDFPDTLGSATERSAGPQIPDVLAIGGTSEEYMADAARKETLKRAAEEIENAKRQEKEKAERAKQDVVTEMGKSETSRREEMQLSEAKRLQHATSSVADSEANSEKLRRDAIFARADAIIAARRAKQDVAAEERKDQLSADSGIPGLTVGQRRSLEELGRTWRRLAPRR